MSENLTLEELRKAMANISDGLELPCVVDGVHFGKTSIGTITFSYSNCRGLIFPDNGYRGHMEDKKDYYLLWRLSCQHNQECKYNPTFEPGLKNAAAAIKASWERFTSGK